MTTTATTTREILTADRDTVGDTIRDAITGERVTSYGYFLSCEQYGPRDLVDQARRAEDAGFDRLWISDHFHPWLDEQGESPFVWSVIGALSQVTSLPISTAPDHDGFSTAYRDEVLPSLRAR